MPPDDLSSRDSFNTAATHSQPIPEPARPEATPSAQVANTALALNGPVPPGHVRADITRQTHAAAMQRDTVHSDANNGHNRADPKTSPEQNIKSLAAKFSAQNKAKAAKSIDQSKQRDRERGDD
jgi:hypothetical protein